MEINFKIWLEGMEDYEPFKGLVSRAASGRSFAFEKWFPEERIYLPIDVNENEDLTKEINDAFEDYGFAVSDLTNGYAVQKNSGSKNVFKIGKLIQKFYKKDLQDLEQRFKSEKLSPAQYENEKRLTGNYWNDLDLKFNDRVSLNSFLVVISKEIHDIASMSTGRGWTSCMTLGTGSHHGNVYCEVKNGGFIAYLIRSDDKNIRKPISRIHIRRFDNKRGNSLAIPEESIYGKDVPEFLNVVKDWLKSKQGNIVPGFYTRQGGRYSDTWGTTRKTFVPPDPTDMKLIESWLTKWIKMKNEDREKFYPYFLNTIQSYFQSNERFSDDFNRKLKDYLFSDSVFKVGWLSQTTEQFLPAFSLKNPELIERQDFEKAFKYAAKRQEVMIEKLAKKFPEFMTEKLFDEIQSERVKDDVLKNDPELESYYKQKLENDASEIFDVNNALFKVTERDSIWSVFGKISDELRKFEKFKPLPEKIIRILVNFGNNVDKLQLVPETKATNPVVASGNEANAERIKDDILGLIIHILSITGSDTPTVQRFYQSLLPRYEQLGGIGILGRAMLNLKENGKQFLPFLMKKQEELTRAANKRSEQESGFYADKRMYDDALEAYNYVIDGLQNPDFRSAKYRFSYGKGIEYKLAQEENQKKRDEMRRLMIHRFTKRPDTV